MFNSSDGAGFVGLRAAGAGHADCTDDLITQLQRHAAAEQQQFRQGVEVGRFSWAPTA